MNAAVIIGGGMFFIPGVFAVIVYRKAMRLRDEQG